MKECQKLEYYRIYTIIGTKGKMTCIEYKDYIDTFKFVSKLGDGNCASVVKVQDIKTKR